MFFDNLPVCPAVCPSAPGPSALPPLPSRPCEIWEWGHPEIWDPTNPISDQKNITFIELKIRSVQHDHNVLIGKKYKLLTLCHAISDHFVHGPNKSKKVQIYVYFPWWANEPYSPIWALPTNTLVKVTTVPPFLYADSRGAHATLDKLILFWMLTKRWWTVHTLMDTAKT